VTERESLIRAVCEAPADDAHRLAFAEYLNDHPESAADRHRAEFIRVQCALAAGPAHACGRAPGRAFEFDPNSDCGRCRWLRGLPALRDRERELYELPGCGWPHWWPGRASAFTPTRGPTLHAFRRGLLWSVSYPLAAFLAAATDLFGASPIGQVVVTDRHPREVVDDHWVWYRAGSPGEDGVDQGAELPLETREATLPGEVWEELTGWRDECQDERWYTRVWPQAVTGALSDACVAYGRKAVGLGP